jgi:Flp pilus assembly pilin Flp
MIARLILKALNAQEAIKHMAQDEKGGVVVEYGLLVGLLVLGMAAGMATFAESIQNWLTTISAAVAGWGPVVKQ